MFNQLEGIVINKAISIIGKFIDQRSGKLEGNVYRDYYNRAEVLEKLTGVNLQHTAAIRTGHFPVYITPEGGDTTVWWFINGTTDDDLVEMSMGGGGTLTLPPNTNSDDRLFITTTPAGEPLIKSKFVPFLPLTIVGGVSTPVTQIPGVMYADDTPGVLTQDAPAIQVNGTRSQRMYVTGGSGPMIWEGCVFSCGVYSYVVTETVLRADTPLTFWSRVVNKVNNTSAAQWRSIDPGSAPADGTAGFEPTAIAYIAPGATNYGLILNVDGGHTFAASMTWPTPQPIAETVPGQVYWDFRVTTHATLSLAVSANMQFINASEGDEAILKVVVPTAGAQLTFTGSHKQLVIDGIEETEIGWVAGELSVGTWACRIFKTGNIFYWDIKLVKDLIGNGEPSGFRMFSDQYGDEFA